MIGWILELSYLKEKGALLIFDRFTNLKYRYENRHFWCRGYYVDAVGRNKKAIAEYIKESAARRHSQRSGADERIL